MGVRTDGETVVAVVTFAPPAVEDAHVEAAVAAGLHPARARRFKRSPRRVEPHVAAGDHLTGSVDVVVFNKDQMPLQIAVLAEVDDVLDVAFAIVVTWVRFAGEDELNWPRLVASQSHDVIQLLKDERRALVSR